MTEPVLVKVTPKPSTWWRHKASGGVYRIICNALVESTMEDAVVYMSRTGQCWVRPLANFMDGRFELINEEFVSEASAIGEVT